MCNLSSSMAEAYDDASRYYLALALARPCALLPSTVVPFDDVARHYDLTRTMVRPYDILPVMAKPFGQAARYTTLHGRWRGHTTSCR